MSGDPRYAIHVSALVFQLAHAHAARIGFRTTSDWLRSLLWAWDGEPIDPRVRRVRHLGVRLSPPLQARLAHIAAVSQIPMSEAFGALVERALFADLAPEDDGAPPQRSRVAPDQRGKPTSPARAEATPAMPAPDDHAAWAREIRAAARRTPHTFGPTKAFIAGVIEELIERFQSADPDLVRATVRAILPTLNRLGLVRLSRADLVAEMDPRLVRDSAISYLNATFHFVDLD